MLLMALLLACSGEDEPTATTPDDTGTQPVGRCASTDNALRMDCPLDAPGTLAWWPEDDPNDVRTADGTTQVRIHMLRPDVRTIVEFPDGSTEAQSPIPLPNSLAGLSTTLTGKGLSTWIAVSGSCDPREVVVLDTQGRPRWYQTLDRKMIAIDVTPTNTLLVLDGATRLREFTPNGDEVWDAVYEDTERPLHHDIARDARGYTYALQADVYPIDGVNYVLDGLAVFDPSGAHVQTWKLIDHLPNIYEPTNNNGYWTVRFPNAIDFSHGNSVEITPDGDLLLSFRWLDTVLKMDGDPTSSTFGTPQWWLSSTGQVPSDLDLVGPDAAFDGQHHVNIAPDGRLLMFDNTERGTNSRGLAYVIRENTATLDQVWPLANDCSVQGSTYGLADGGAQVTCASRSLVTEFPANSEVPRGSLEMTCTTDTPTLTARAVPIDW